MPRAWSSSTKSFGGAPSALTAPYADRILEVIAAPRATVLAVVAADPDVEDVAAFGDRFHVRVRAASGPLGRLPAALTAAGARVQSVRPIPATLEDAFIALLAADAPDALPAATAPPPPSVAAVPQSGRVSTFLNRGKAILAVPLPQAGWPESGTLA